jgi:N-acetylneuraminate synthase
MTTVAEQEKFVKFFEEKGQGKRLVVYSCTSGYPVPFENVCMLEILKMQDRFHGRIKELAFSGHHLGIAIDVAAYTLGAVWVERHFTKDRTWKGTDHAASLEYSGLQKLCRDLNSAYHSLTYKETEILPIEQVQRDKLKYRER